MESYEKMLGLYSSSSADGSALREAEKSSNNLTGSLNKLSNTWTDTVENIADSDTLKSGINLLNDLLGIVNKLTGSLEGLGTLGAIGGIALNRKLGLQNATLTIGKRCARLSGISRAEMKDVRIKHKDRFTP